MDFELLWQLLYEHGASARKEEGTRRYWDTLTAEKHQIKPKRVRIILVWFYREAKNRQKYNFLQKFPPSEEHIVRF